jgi:hypothetical protein
MLTSRITVGTLRNALFNFRKLCVLPAQYVYGFHFTVGANNDYVPKEHRPVNHFNLNVVNS